VPCSIVDRRGGHVRTGHGEDLQYYERACAAGSNAACTAIGTFHRIGAGSFPKDLDKAEEIFL